MTGATNTRGCALVLVAAVTLGVGGFASAADAGAAGDRRACVGPLGLGSRSKGAVSSVRTGLGTYDVTFDKTLARCVTVATLANCNTFAQPSPGGITVGPSFANGFDTLRVRTFTPGGVPANREFHLYVDCD